MLASVLLIMSVYLRYYIDAHVYLHAPASGSPVPSTHTHTGHIYRERARVPDLSPSISEDKHWLDLFNYSTSRSNGIKGGGKRGRANGKKRKRGKKQVNRENIIVGKE